VKREDQLILMGAAWRTNGAVRGGFVFLTMAAVVSVMNCHSQSNQKESNIEEGVAENILT
jgi:hypothetical protein